MGGQKEGPALSPCLSRSLMEQFSLAFSVKISRSGFTGWGWIGFQANSARCQAGLGVVSASARLPLFRCVSAGAPSKSLRQCVSWMRTLILHTPVRASNSHGGHGSKATTLLSHACFKLRFLSLHEPTHALNTSDTLMHAQGCVLHTQTLHTRTHSRDDFWPPSPHPDSAYPQSSH